MGKLFDPKQPPLGGEYPEPEAGEEGKNKELLHTAQKVLNAELDRLNGKDDLCYCSGQGGHVKFGIHCRL